MKSLNLTREEIYDLVWEKPVSRLAGEPGVKPSELHGYCVKFEIPLPEQGHWSRVQFGKEVTKTPLPPTSVNKLSEEIVIEEKEISKADPPRVVFFKEKRVKKKAIGAGTVRHGRTISPGGWPQAIMRSYGPSVQSSASFFTLVSENNWFVSSLFSITNAAGCFCYAGAFAAQAKIPRGGGRDRQ